MKSKFVNSTNNRFVRCIKDVIHRPDDNIMHYETWDKVGEEYEISGQGEDGELYINDCSGTGCHQVGKPGNMWFDEHFILLMNENEFKKEFLDKNNKVAVHCKTEAKAKAFCAWMHDQGLTWCTGYSYLRVDNNFELYFEETCYSNHGEYSPIGFYKDNGWRVIEFDKIKFNEIENNKMGKKEEKEVDMKKVNYEVIKPFNFEMILKRNPCESEQNKAMLELFEAGNAKTDYFQEWEDIKDFECVERNIDWLVEKGFIKKCKKPFKPFYFKIKIDNEEDLKSLYARFILINREVNEYGNYSFKCTREFNDEVDALEEILYKNEIKF